MKKKRLLELLRYGVTGLTITIVNLGIYHILLYFRIDYRVTNLVALVGSKAYGYFASKLFVFKTHCEKKQDLVKEILRYILARCFSGVIDYVGLLLSVEVLGVDKVNSKYVIQVLVIALNYILGKHMVFRSKTCFGVNSRVGKISNNDANTGETENGVQPGQPQKVYDQKSAEMGDGRQI